MRHLRPLVVLILVPLCASGAPSQDLLCAPLLAFAGSVAPGQTHAVEFHTVWGGDFKSATARSLYTIQCIDHGYGPGKAVCDVLMHDGAIEFSGNNAKRAVSCLSPTMHWGSPMMLDRLELSFSYGTPNRGSNITVSYGPASKELGMVMVVTAAGY